MAIIKGIRKLLKSDFPDAPAWFDQFIGVFNQFMDTTIGGLRNKLTFRDNFYCEVKEYTFTHATELQVGHDLNDFKGCLLIGTPEDTPATTYGISEFHFRKIDNSTVGITVEFASATDADSATTTGTVKFIILG